MRKPNNLTDCVAGWIKNPRKYHQKKKRNAPPYTMILPLAKIFVDQNYGKIWENWLDLGKFWSDIWAKLKSCIPKNTQSPTAMSIQLVDL